MKFVGVSAPAWTFRGDRARSETKTNGVPGPNYTEDKEIFNGVKKTKYRYPEWKFGSGKRKNFFGKIPEYPAPNHYFQPGENEPVEKPGEKKRKRAEDENKPFITKDKRFSSEGKTDPVGPGTYENYDEDCKMNPLPKFSFGYKFESPIFYNDNELGPGHYNPSYTQKEFSKSYGIWKPGERKPIFPAGMNENDRKKLEEKINKRKERQKKLQKFRRMKKRQSQTPGPGHFNPNFPPDRLSFNRTTGTFGKSKRDDIYKGLVGRSPGPPDLSDIFSNRGNKNNKDNKGRRKPGDDLKKDRMDNGVPGPGSYNPNLKKIKPLAPIYMFGKGKRPPLNPKPCYEPQEKSEIDEFTEDDSNEMRMNKEYTFNDVMNKGKNYPRFGKEKRIDMNEELNHEKVTPGPGSYIGKHYRYKKNNKNESEDPDVGERPTPRNRDRTRVTNINYPAYRSAPKFSFKGRRPYGSNSRNDYRGPGPGSYNVSDYFDMSRGKFRSIGIDQRFRTMQKLKRSQRKKLLAYEERGLVGNMEANAYKFGKAKRSKPGNNVDPDIEVGPGSYEIKSTIPQLQCYEMLRMKDEGIELNME